MRGKYARSPTTAMPGAAILRDASIKGVFLPVITPEAPGGCELLLHVGGASRITFAGASLAITGELVAMKIWLSTPRRSIARRL